MPNRYGPRADWWREEGGSWHWKVLMSSAIKDQIGLHVDRFYNPNKASMYIFGMEVVVDDTGYLKPGEFQISYGIFNHRGASDAFDGGLTVQKILRAKKALEESGWRRAEWWQKFEYVDPRNIQIKENSNMSNTTTPEYSKNCAVKTLQQQLERAQQNHASNVSNTEEQARNRDFYQKNVDYWQKQQDESARHIKELKLGLKKLGAGPRVTD